MQLRSFLIHIDRLDGKAQSEALADALTRNGTSAEVFVTNEKRSARALQLVKSLGRDDFPTASVVVRVFIGSFPQSEHLLG
jgi:hypothetical protein